MNSDNRILIDLGALMIPSPFIKSLKDHFKIPALIDYILPV